jgi:hypothetical protein
MPGVQEAAGCGRQVVSRVRTRQRHLLHLRQADPRHLNVLAPLQRLGEADEQGRHRRCPP